MNIERSDANGPHASNPHASGFGAGRPDTVYRVTSRRYPWWILLIAGLIVCGVGVALISWPAAPVWLLVILFGAGLIANGIALLTRGSPSAGSVLLGILLILVGVLSILFIGFTADVFVTFVGVVLVTLGAVWIIAGSRFAGGAGIIVAPAVVLLITGIVTLVWPDAVLTVIAIVSGVLMLLLGIALIIGAFRVRRLRYHVLQE